MGEILPIGGCLDEKVDLGLITISLADVLFTNLRLASSDVQPPIVLPKLGIGNVYELRDSVLGEIKERTTEDQPVNLAGLSGGGPIAVNLLVTQPEIVDTVCTVSAPLKGGVINLEKLFYPYTPFISWLSGADLRSYYHTIGPFLDETLEGYLDQAEVFHERLVLIGSKTDEVVPLKSATDDRYVGAERIRVNQISGILAHLAMMNEPGTVQAITDFHSGRLAA